MELLRSQKKTEFAKRCASQKGHVIAVESVAGDVVAGNAAEGNAAVVVGGVIPLPDVYPVVVAETDFATMKAVSTHQQTRFVGQCRCYSSSIPCGLL